MSEIRLETKPFAFINSPLWLIAALTIVLSLYDETLLGPAIFVSLISISLLHYRNLTPLIAFPTFIGINSEFMHKFIFIGNFSFSWKVPLLLCIIIYVLNFIYRQKKLNSFAVSPYFSMGWLVYLLFVSFKTQSFSFSPYAFVGLLFGLSIASQLFANENRENSRFLLILFFLSVLFMILVGYVEVIFERTFLMSQWAQEERYRFGIMRIGSTVADSNFLCSILLPSLFIFNTTPFKKIITPSKVVFVNVIIVLQIFLTFSRTGMVLFFIGLSLLFILRSKHAKLLFIGLLPVVFFVAYKVMPLLMDVDINSNAARGFVNNLAFNTFLENPLFGIGLGNFTSVSEQYTDSVVGALDTMNTYMSLLTSGGIISLCFYLVYIGFIYNKSKLLTSYDRRLFLVGFLLYNMFIYTIDSFFIYFTWIFPAILLALIHHSTDKKSEKDNSKSGDIDSNYDCYDN